MVRLLDLWIGHRPQQAAMATALMVAAGHQAVIGGAKGAPLTSTDGAAFNRPEVSVCLADDQVIARRACRSLRPGASGDGTNLTLVTARLLALCQEPANVSHSSLLGGPGAHHICSVDA